MRKLLAPALGLAGVVALVAGWMRYTRIGAGFANDVVNPYLVRRGLSGSGGSELATLEHVGRRSGIRRQTPLHAILTADGVRFAVPLGDRSEWARNVLAAGRCRMRYQDTHVELDDPRLLDPTEDPAMGPILGRITQLLGWKYLVLHRVSDQPGSLEQDALERHIRSQSHGPWRRGSATLECGGPVSGPDSIVAATGSGRPRP